MIKPAPNTLTNTTPITINNNNVNNNIQNNIITIHSPSLYDVFFTRKLKGHFDLFYND